MAKAKFLKNAVLIGGVFGSLAFATGANATISIGLQQAGVNGGAITTVATDSGFAGAAFFGGSYGTFTFNSVTAQAAPLLPQGSLSTTSIQTSSSTAGTIAIYITASDLSSLPSSFLSSFTSNTFAGSAVSVVESTYYSASNALYGGTLMASQTFTNIGTAQASYAPAAGTGAYSETVKYIVTVGSGFSNVNDTINITAQAVPEPATWAMMVGGFGLLGATMRRRRTTTVRFA